MNKLNILSLPAYYGKSFTRNKILSASKTSDIKIIHFFQSISLRTITMIHGILVIFYESRATLYKVLDIMTTPEQTFTFYK